MANKKLDDEKAFADYVAMGAARSYTAVAKRHGVSKRALTKAAHRGNWARRLEEIEREAQKQADKKLVETQAEVRERQLRMVKAIAARGIQAVQAYPLDNARDGIKAVEAALKWERAILGEQNERAGTRVEELTRREVESFLADATEPPDGEADW